MFKTLLKILGGGGVLDKVLCEASQREPPCKGPWGSPPLSCVSPVIITATQGLIITKYPYLSRTLCELDGVVSKGQKLVLIGYFQKVMIIILFLY